MAWSLLLPCTLAVVLAVLTLGPPLGHLLSGPDVDFWPAELRTEVRPEPTERARYVLSLLGPCLLGAMTVALVRARPMTRRPAASLLMHAGRVGVILAVVACVAYQRTVTYGVVYEAPQPFRTAYFTVPTLVVAVALAAALAAVLGSETAVRRLRGVARETRAKRSLAFGAGLLFVAIWLLTAFNTNTSILSVNRDVWDNIPFWIDEAFGILNGSAPLVGFHAQYAQLWSYVVAGGLAVFGTSFTVYTSVMIAGTMVTMLVVLDVLRRLIGSSFVALALFVPFVATSFFMQSGPPENRYGPSNLFSFFPIRYLGPYVLLWLVVRRVERRPSRPPLVLFTFAGLVVINNVEFGIPAFGAALAVLIATGAPVKPVQVVRVLGSALFGLVAAAAIVAALTLAVAGALPHFEMIATFPRIFSEGYGMLPMPAAGLHLVLYATFAAAIVTAVVRLLEGTDDARLTGALIWVGVFGLGTGAYFVGRSHPQVLINLFSAWALALGLLAVVVARGIAERPGRRPAAVELLVFACLGLAVCSLAQTPAPWSQWHRIAQARRDAGTIEIIRATRRAAVRVATTRGEAVALLMREGHHIAEDLGVVDVTPYACLDSMPTRTQWTETLRALRDAGGTKILAPIERMNIEQAKWLLRSGFKVRQTYREANLIEFVARA